MLFKQYEPIIVLPLIFPIAMVIFLLILKEALCSCCQNLLDPTHISTSNLNQVPLQISLTKLKYYCYFDLVNHLLFLADTRSVIKEQKI